MPLVIRTTDERKVEVYDIVLNGSSPRAAFFVLVALSTVIAAFGLLMNSTAVVIGAMLVAPLMTPIMGLGLALIRGDSKLLGRSLRAETLGVVIAIGAATLLGLLFVEFDATPEMLGRTSPNLLDLLVAVLAGLAGAYAIVDEKISPALPGVAISTAIVPPLANVGLSLARGAYDGALGSFLLFFSNFLSILLVSALIFYLAGMAEEKLLRHRGALTRRFGIAIAGFFVVAFILTHELADMVRQIELRHQIRQTLEQEFAHLRVTEIAKLEFQESEGKLVVLTRIHAPHIITPREIKNTETILEQQIDMPVELFVKSTLTHDVSATGSVGQAIFETLDGILVPDVSNVELARLKTAEQVVREYLGDKVRIELEDIESFTFGRETYFHADISGWRALRRKEIAELETLLQERLPDVEAHLVVVQDKVQLTDRVGHFRPEFITWRPLSESEKAVEDAVLRLAERYLDAKGQSIVSASVAIFDNTYHAFFDVVGPQILPQAEVNHLETELLRETGIPIEVLIRSVPEAVMTKDGYTTFEEVLTTFGERARQSYEGAQAGEKPVAGK